MKCIIIRIRNICLASTYGVQISLHRELCRYFWAKSTAWKYRQMLDCQYTCSRRGKTINYIYDRNFCYYQTYWHEEMSVGLVIETSLWYLLWLSESDISIDIVNRRWWEGSSGRKNRCGNVKRKIGGSK